MQVIYERVAGIDVGKDEVAVAVRVPGQDPDVPRVEQVRKYKSFYPTLLKLADWLRECGVTHVAMESTGVYWWPVFHALCQGDTDAQLASGASTFEIQVVNAGHVKNVPGRKSDVKDCSWLAQLLEVGLLRGSFIPPTAIISIRDLTRYRKKLIESRVSELARLGKVCQDAGIKIDSVASSLTTLSARHMIEKLIDGERDPRVLADLALGTMKSKRADLSMALAGRWDAHHSVLARAHLDQIDHLEAMISRLDAQVEVMVSPFAAQITALCTIPGIGDRTAQVIISEIGVDMSRFPTAEHLASWAGLCPGNNESAGKHGNTKTRKGNTHLRTALVEAAWTTLRTSSYLGARFRRLRARFGRKGGGKAAVAIAHQLLIIIFYVLRDGVAYQDLGPDYYARANERALERHKQHIVRELQNMGYTVTITPAA